METLLQREVSWSYPENRAWGTNAQNIQQQQNIFKKSSLFFWRKPLILIRQHTQFRSVSFRQQTYTTLIHDDKRKLSTYLASTGASVSWSSKTEKVKKNTHRTLFFRHKPILSTKQRVWGLHIYSISLIGYGGTAPLWCIAYE